MKVPRVDIFCPCREDIDNSIEQQVIPKHLWSKHSRHQLEWLYFCDRCRAIRCWRCIEQELVSIYCPSCLFQVTANTSKSDGNRCMRNCFECSKCHSSMAVKEAVGEEKQYVLVCNYCDWSSDSIGLLFKQPSSIATQLISGDRRQTKEADERFAELKEIYHKNSLDEVAGHDRDLTNFLNIIQHKQEMKKSKGGKVAPVKILKEKPEVEASSIDRNLFSPSSASTSHTYPLLRRLRAKKNRRCKSCREVLVKPEIKPTSTKYKLKLMAMSFLPSLCISAFKPSNGGTPVSYPNMMEDGKTYTVLLTVSNPLSVPMKVNLSTIAKNSSPNFPHGVTIISPPTFTLGPVAELWDEASLVQGVPSTLITRQTTVTRKVAMDGDRQIGVGGYHESGKNWVTLILEIVPCSATNLVEIPIFVSFSYQDGDAGVDNNEKKSAPTAKSEGTEKEIISVGFWSIMTLAETSPNELEGGINM